MRHKNESPPYNSNQKSSLWNNYWQGLKIKLKGNLVQESMRVTTRKNINQSTLVCEQKLETEST